MFAFTGVNKFILFIILFCSAFVNYAFVTCASTTTNSTETPTTETPTTETVTKITFSNKLYKDPKKEELWRMMAPGESKRVQKFIGGMVMRKVYTWYRQIDELTKDTWSPKNWTAKKTPSREYDAR